MNSQSRAPAKQDDSKAKPDATWGQIQPTSCHTQTNNVDVKHASLNFTVFSVDIKVMYKYVRASSGSMHLLPFQRVCCCQLQAGGSEYNFKSK